MADYHPQELDKKWQKSWADSRAFEVSVDRSRPKFYCLEMFAYPSGHAHVGHVRNYIIGDVMARTKRMRGYNVLHPFGWDAFGLPAENAAIKSGIHPEVSTRGNIAHMKGQLQRLGISYAWERELATCDPEYYKWNQWLFIRMFERGLAYRRKSSVNWCPVDNTVLANEQVVDGGCWRCGTPVETRDLEQWFFRITAYADELLDATAELTRWPEKVLTMQRNWIGRSEGARVKFRASDGLGIRDSGRIPDPESRLDRGLHHAHRHDLRRDVRAARPRASARGSLCGAFPRSRGVQAEGAGVPDAGSRRACQRRHREAGLRYRFPRDQSVYRSACSDLGGELRPRRVRNRCGHGRAGARRTRLRVRPQVQSAYPRCRDSRWQVCIVRRHDRGDARLRHARRLGRVQRSQLGERAEAHDRVGEGSRHR